MYNQFEKERDQGNFDLLPELHAILSGMKVLCPPLLHFAVFEFMRQECELLHSNSLL